MVESKIVSAVRGNDVNDERLCQIGKRVFNLQRAVLVRESDTPPETDYRVPLRFERGNPEGLLPGKELEVISRKGAVVDREKFEKVKEGTINSGDGTQKPDFKLRRSLKNLNFTTLAKN